MLKVSSDILSTLKVRIWAKINVPMLYWIGPEVIELSDRRIEVAIPLSKRNKNHLNSMYFGALTCGAEFSGGLLAIEKIRQHGQAISLIFKNFSAQFLKRAEAKTHFICEDGEVIIDLVNRAAISGKREEATVSVFAVCPSLSPTDPVAKFTLTISLKKSTKLKEKNWIQKIFKV